MRRFRRDLPIQDPAIADDADHPTRRSPSEDDNSRDESSPILSSTISSHHISAPEHPSGEGTTDPTYPSSTTEVPPTATTANARFPISSSSGFSSSLEDALSSPPLPKSPTTGLTEVKAEDSIRTTSPTKSTSKASPKAFGSRLNISTLGLATQALTPTPAPTPATGEFSPSLSHPISIRAIPATPADLKEAVFQKQPSGFFAGPEGERLALPPMKEGDNTTSLFSGGEMGKKDRRPTITLAGGTTPRAMGSQEIEGLNPGHQPDGGQRSLFPASSHALLESPGIGWSDMVDIPVLQGHESSQQSRQRSEIGVGDEIELRQISGYKEGLDLDPLTYTIPDEVAEFKKYAGGKEDIESITLGMRALIAMEGEHTSLGIVHEQLQQKIVALEEEKSQLITLNSFASREMTLRDHNYKSEIAFLLAEKNSLRQALDERDTEKWAAIMDKRKLQKNYDEYTKATKETTDRLLLENELYWNSNERMTRDIKQLKNEKSSMKKALKELGEEKRRRREQERQEREQKRQPGAEEYKQRDRGSPETGRNDHDENIDHKNIEKLGVEGQEVKDKRTGQSEKGKGRGKPEEPVLRNLLSLYLGPDPAEGREVTGAQKLVNLVQEEEEKAPEQEKRSFREIVGQWIRFQGRKEQGGNELVQRGAKQGDLSRLESNQSESIAASKQRATVQTVDLALLRCEIALQNMAYERALHGIRPMDARVAISAAEDALSMTKELDPEQWAGCVARCYFWAGVANFYGDCIAQSRSYLNWFSGRDWCAKALDPDREGKWLQQWLELGDESPPRNPEGYRRGISRSEARGTNTYATTGILGLESG